MRIRLFPALAALVLALSAPAKSAEGQPSPAIQASCMTEMPSTSFFLESTADTLVVQVVHHNGTKFVPIALGLVNAYDLPRLNDLALMMSHLGERAVYRFPLSGCAFPQAGDKELFVCFPGQKTRIGGMEVEPLTVYTVRRTEESFAGSFQKLEIHMSVQVGGRGYSFAMEYAPSECLFTVPEQKPITTGPGPVREK